jgi:hypothetical protein
LHLGFIKDTEVRMGGAHIAICRLLRLKNGLRATINSPKFISLRQFKEEISILQSEDFWNYVFSISCALYAPMRVLRLADQKVTAMDKVHFYVCQTDANMSYYLTKAVTDSGRCTHDETLRLMYACSQDNNVDEVDSNDKDDEESVVEDDADEEVTSNSKESGEDGSGEDDDSAGAFTSDAIGAGRGQLRQVTPCVLYIFWLCKLIFSCLVRSSALLSQFPGDQMDHVAMRFWIKRRDHLIHDYSLAGYLLSPNATIMAHAYANRSTMHNDAVVHLIEKLIINPMLVGDEKSSHLSKDIETFWNEYDDFVNMRGCFSLKYMWDTAWGDNLKVYRWHQRYSLQATKVLGKLACLVLSKILGIGTAEQIGSKSSTSSWTYAVTQTQTR